MVWPYDVYNFKMLYLLLRVSRVSRGGGVNVQFRAHDRRGPWSSSQISYYYYYYYCVGTVQ